MKTKPAKVTYDLESQMFTIPNVFHLSDLMQACSDRCITNIMERIATWTSHGSAAFTLLRGDELLELLKETPLASIFNSRLSSLVAKYPDLMVNLED